MPLIDGKSEGIRERKEGEVMSLSSQTEDVVVSQLIAPIPGGHRQHRGTTAGGWGVDRPDACGAST